MSIWTSEDFKEFPSRYEKTGEEMSGGASFHVARTILDHVDGGKRIADITPADRWGME